LDLFTVIPLPARLPRDKRVEYVSAVVDPQFGPSGRLDADFIFGLGFAHLV